MFIAGFLLVTGMARAAVAALGVGLGSIALGFVGEIVVADGESVLGVVGATAEVVAPDKAYGGDFALCGQGEDVGGVEEEVLAKVARGAGFLAEMVVANEEEGCLAVVGDVADDAAELCGDAYSAERHEMVDVVDDDELWLELTDECLDVAVDGVEVVTLAAENVEADEMEVLLCLCMGCQLAVDAGADVWAVECVDPENLAGSQAGIVQAGSLQYLNGLLRGTGEDLDGEVLGEVVGSACVLAGEVGDVVLPDDGLVVDGYQRLAAGELAEVGLVGELAVLPGFLFALGGGITIIVDFHGDFVFFISW